MTKKLSTKAKVIFVLLKIGEVLGIGLVLLILGGIGYLSEPYLNDEIFPPASTFFEYVGLGILITVSFVVSFVACLFAFGLLICFIWEVFIKNIINKNKQWAQKIEKKLK